jgi:tetratricopeptide (TPR) repeat protein
MPTPEDATIASLEALFRMEAAPSFIVQEDDFSTRTAVPQTLQPVSSQHLAERILQAMNESLSQWHMSPFPVQQLKLDLARYAEAESCLYAVNALYALYHTLAGQTRQALRYTYRAMNQPVHATHALRWAVYISLAHIHVMQGLFHQGRRAADQALRCMPGPYIHLRHHAQNMRLHALEAQNPSLFRNMHLWGSSFAQVWRFMPALHQARLVQGAHALFRLAQVFWGEVRHMPLKARLAQSHRLQETVHLNSVILHSAQLELAHFQWPSALKRLKRAIRRMPSQPLLWLELARVYRSLGHAAKTRHALERTIALMPSMVLAQVELGLAYMDEHQLVNAMECFTLAYLHSRKSTQKRKLAYIMTDALERYQVPGARAVASLNDVWQSLSASMALLLKLDQEGHAPTAATLSHMAKLANALGQRQLAMHACEMALELQSGSPPTQCHVNLAYASWQAGYAEKAAYYYHRALEQDVSNALAHNNLGSIYLDHLHQLEEAKTHFEHALQHNNGFALAHFNLGRLHLRRNQYTEAARSFACAKAANLITQELDNAEIDHQLHKLFDHL